MGSSPSPPAAPDPVATAQAQSQYNQNTATTQQLLNMTNQVTPYGNLTYNQTGSNTYTGADGKQYTVPQFTATTTLSPEQQDLYNLNTNTQKTLGQIGVDQSAKVAGILNTPFDLNGATNNQQADISRKLLDPVWGQRQNELEQKLANQGIQQGSEAYTNAMRDFGMQRDNSYNSALLGGRAQATQEALANRNQPLNEISALMSGSQVSQPNFVGTPQTQVAPTDYTSAVNNNYQGQMAGYNAQLQNQGALYGALGSMAGTALGGWGMGGFKGLSDRRAKTDIKRVGKLDNGLNVYSYRYKAGGAHMIGVMADEVEKVMPEAISVIGGLKHVDYAKAVGV